jgi:hypothetical protein
LTNLHALYHGTSETTDTREQSTETPANERGTKSPRDHRRQVGRLLLRLLAPGYRDSLLERPDLVEDD